VVLHRVEGERLTSLGITSPRHGDGRSTLARSMALIERRDYGRRTVLLELDVEAASMSAELGLQPGPGIVELLHGEAEVEDCLQWLDGDLAVITRGERVESPGWVIGHLQGSGLWHRLRWHADVVVADLPPLLDSSVGPQAAALMETQLLVVRAGRTSVAEAVRAAATLPEPPCVVLNGQHSKIPRWIRRSVGDVV
jgi:Mrp family chromosome partitioning ATPase